MRSITFNITNKAVFVSEVDTYAFGRVLFQFNSNEQSQLSKMLRFQINNSRYKSTTNNFIKILGLPKKNKLTGNFIIDHINAFVGNDYKQTKVNCNTVNFTKNNQHLEYRIKGTLSIKKHVSLYSKSCREVKTNNYICLDILKTPKDDILSFYNHTNPEWRYENFTIDNRLDHTIINLNLNINTDEDLDFQQIENRIMEIESKSK